MINKWFTQFSKQTEEYFGANENWFDLQHSTVNISDESKVFVRIEKKSDEDEVIRYQYSNHLGSACLELDVAGLIISYEEYHPFGTTSYRSGANEVDVSLKRYKYCGKERDEETGLYYYGMRCYAAWLCRFINVDPLQFKYPYYTPFQYAGNKPITYIDLDGLEEIKPKELFSESYLIRSSYENGTTYIDLSWKGIEFNVNGQINYSISARYAFISPTGEFDKVSETRTTEINTMSLMDNGINSINEIDLMGGFGIVIPQQQYDLPIFTGEIVPVSGLNALELWFETPPNNLGDFFLKMVGNVGYSMLNSQYSYFTGKTISGSYLNPIERTDAFVDFAPGLLFFGLDKTIPVIETAGDGLQAYNKVKNEATEFGHIF